MLERIITYFSNQPLVLIVSLLPLLPIILAVGVRAYKDPILKLLTIYLVTDLLCNIILFILAINGIYNIWLINVFFLFEAMMFGYIYYQLFHSKSIKIFITITLILATLITIFDFKTLEISPFATAFDKVLMIIFVFLHFNTILSEMKIKNILLHPPFWISVGIIIYAAGSFSIDLFSNYIFNDSDETFFFFLNMKRIVNIIFLLILSVAIWVKKYNTIEELP
jgi:hypothetical protein